MKMVFDYAVNLTGFLLLIVFAATANGQIPKEIAALASIYSNDYYLQTNIPFHSFLADTFAERMENIKESSLPGLAAEYRSLRAAREKLFQLDAVSFAVASETPIQDALDAMKIKWATNPGARQDFTPDVDRAFAGRLQQMNDLAEIWEMTKAPRKTIAQAWTNYSAELQKLEVLESTPIAIDFGFVENIGYGVVENNSDHEIDNLIVVFNFETDYRNTQKSGNWLYFLPKLEPGKKFCFAESDMEWPVSWTEQDPKKFNLALDTGALKIEADLYCDDGRIQNVSLKHRDGLRLRMEFLRSILSRGAVFESRGGGQIVIQRSSGSGTTLNLTTEDGAKATLNAKWHGGQQFTDFEPRSTAFRIRLLPSEKEIRNRTQNVSPLMRGLVGDGEQRYTWRGGNLYSESGFGLSTVLYPSVGTTSENQDARVDVDPEPMKPTEPDKFGFGARWHGTINFYDQKNRFTSEPTYELVRDKGVSLIINGENSGRLMIDGHDYSLVLEIADTAVKASLKDEQAPLFGPRLLAGEWSGVRRGSRLTLKRKVEVPPKNKTESETITLRYEDPPKER